MKKLILALTLALGLAVVFPITTDAQSTDRNVLLEVFTSTTCPPCGPAAITMHSFLSNYDHADRVSVIKYPVWFPTTGCIFYHQNPTPVLQRNSFYGGIAGAPQAFVDGINAGHTASGWINQIQNRMNVASPLEIQVSANRVGSTVEVDVYIENISGSAIPSPVSLRAAIVEKSINYNAPNNNTTVQYFTHRNMLPAAAGSVVTLGEEDYAHVQLSGDLGSGWNHDNLQVVVFVQSDTGNRAVYQSAFADIVQFPELPALTYPDHGATNLPEFVELGWEAVTGSAHYEVQISKKANMHGSEVFSNLSGTDLEVGPLDENTTYYWRVRHRFAGNYSAWTETRSFTTATFSISNPSLQLPSPGAIFTQNTVTFQWGSANNATHYRIQVATTNQFGDDDMVVNTTVGGNTHTHEFTHNNTYYWRVRGENDMIEGAWSAAWPFTINMATSINPDGEIPAVVTLKQNYPNPFNPGTMITFALPEASHVLLDVYNMTGQKVATLVNGETAAGTHHVYFDSTNLSSGTYIYRMQADGIVLTRKMLLIK